MKNIFFLTSVILLFSVIGLATQEKGVSNESFHLLQKDYKGQVPYIINSPSVMNYGICNYHTLQRIHELELNKLLGYATGNEKYKIRNNTYGVMSILGIVTVLSGLMISMAYKIKKQEMPVAVRNAFISLSS